MSDIKIHRPSIQNTFKKKVNPENSDKYIPDQYKKFAKGMESQFAELMFKEMNKTVPKLAQGTAQSFYNNMLLKERANAMAEKGNNGIQEMILNEVYPQKFRNKTNFDIHQAQINKFKKNSVEMHDYPKPYGDIAIKKNGVDHE